MKKLLFVLVLLGCLVSGCGDPNLGMDEDNGKLNLMATIFPQYDFVREIAGDKVNLNLLLPPGMESHSYEPTPQDIIRIQNSDLFIYVGGESDSWVENILESLDQPVAALALMDMVDVVSEEYVEGMEHDHDKSQAIEAEYDEHVWTSPKNAMLIVKGITGFLAEADPQNAAYYQENSAAYLTKLANLDQGFAEAVASGSRNTLIFGDRFPFRYFADAYGLQYYAAFPGCSNETEPSASTIAFLINKVKLEEIPVVFYIEFSNQKMADAICESSGAQKRLFHSCHNLNQEDSENGASYLSLMTGNLDALKEALQ